MQSSLKQKVVIIPDTHAPKHNEGAVNAVCQYIKFYKPTKLIHLGDVGDYESISYWMQNKRLSLEGQRIKDDIDSAVNVLNTFSKFAPNAEKIITMGNHDQWVRNYVDAHPELSGYINLENYR
jgi:metallophosphoesterase superfamily enzyme